MKQNMGSTFYVNLLFAALAKSAGFEVTQVIAGDRSENFFNPDKYPFRTFVEPSGVAVKLDKKWRFFNPGIPYLGFGQMPWYREDVRSMLVGDGSYLWITPSISEPSDSAAMRKGKFILSEDGTLTGKVSIEFTGHQAIARRRDEYRDSDAKREENFKEQIRSRISTAEVSNLVIENFDDNSRPLVYRFDLTVPGYAQRAGRRMILQPGVFEYGSKPVFASETRTYSVYFPYPWSENDELDIKLPAGFDLEDANAPSDIADTQKISSLAINIGIDKDSNTLYYKRKFFFGGGGNILFPVGSYSAVRGLFDTFHKNDTHALVVRPKTN